MANKKVYDVSALGSFVRITVKPGTIVGYSGEIIISDFPCEANPINIDDFEVGTLEFDVNGESYRRASVKPITVSVALIPNSDGDKKLNQAALMNVGSEYNLFDLNIHYLDSTSKEHTNTTFKNGILRSVTKGFSISGEGRLETRVYSFQFPPPDFDGI